MIDPNASTNLAAQIQICKFRCIVHRKDIFIMINQFNSFLCSSIKSTMSPSPGLFKFFPHTVYLCGHVDTTRHGCGSKICTQSLNSESNTSHLSGPFQFNN